MHRLLLPGGRVLISDPVRAEEDRQGIMDRFMRLKQDGHIRFYAREELEALFIAAGFSLGERRATRMAFPFAPRKEYEQLYDTLTDRDRCCYGIASKAPRISEENARQSAENPAEKHGAKTIWVENMEIGNTVFIKI